MPTQENLINPCFCISLRAGSVLLSVFDIIYGTIYIFRFMYVEYLRENFFEFFPDAIPNPTKSEFMYEMSRRGNYIATILCGVLLLLATNYLRYYYIWLAASCYIWMITKTFLIISFSIFCNALLESGKSHFQRFGYEILFNIFTNLYFMLVVAAFIRETRIELNNYRAIKPINIERGEHQDYLCNDRETKFNSATSYHFMSPDFFLNAKKIVQSQARYNLHDTHVDDTLLQYIVPDRMVEVVPEDLPAAEEQIIEEPTLTILKDKPSGSETNLKEESVSYFSSQMSMIPDKEDGQQPLDELMPAKSMTAVKLDSMPEGKNTDNI